MIIDFDDLQRLSGYKQVSKVIDWLRERVAYVVGGDGKPRTTDDMLRKVLDVETAEEATPYVSVDKYGQAKAVRGTRTREDKWGKTTIIAPADAPMSEVWRAYEEAVGDSRQTVGWLLRLFMDSEQFAALADKTQKDYRMAIERLVNAPVGNDRFGSVALHRVDKRSIRSYLDTYDAPVAANRHVAILKSAWNWCLERYQIPDNPCIGVTLNREAPRERYVTETVRTALRMRRTTADDGVDICFEQGHGGANPLSTTFQRIKSADTPKRV